MRKPAPSRHGTPLSVWWLLPLVVLALLVGMGWGLWTTYQKREQRYIHQVEGGLGIVSQIQAAGVADWLRRRKGEAAALTDDGLYAQAVRRWHADPTPAQEALVRERLRVLVEHTQYTAAYLVDLQGRVLLSPAQGGAVPRVEALPAPEQGALRTAFDSAQPAAVGLRRDEAFAFAFFSQLAPLFDGSEPVGAVWLVVDARTTLYPLLEVWPNNNRTAESLLVGREGDNVVLLSPLRHRDDAPLSVHTPASAAGGAVVAQAVSGMRGVFYGTDYVGHQVLATASAVSGSDWLLVSKMDTAEAFTDAQRREWLALGLFTSLGLLLVGLVIVLWQWRAWRGERLLKQALERNMLWLDAAQKAASMGYFAYNAERKRFTMSRMANAIFGVPQEGAMLLNDWVAMLHPEDRDSTLAIHSQAMDQRTALRTQYRIRRASDGQERWIEVWGEYGDAQGPQRSRMTGTVQDITERKRAEEQLSSYRAALELQVRVDPLTQVANRLALGEVVAQEWARALRADTPLALLMVDVDHFKAFNDHYGHMAGDLCLQGVARALASSLGRAGDVVARYGGEEFAVLLPGAGDVQACAVAERLRVAVRDLAIDHALGCDVGCVTVSVGVASLVPSEQPSAYDKPSTGMDVAQVLFQQADAALYRAKQQGRDRVVLYSPDCMDALHDPPDSLFLGVS